MKKLFTLAAAALLTWVAAAPVAAAPPMLPATANFVSERGQVFSLALDGQPLTRPVARQVHVARLVPGQHWADFSVPTRYGPPMRFRTTVWLASGLETSYVLVLRPGYGPQLRQLGAVPLGRSGYGPQGNYPGGGYPQGYPQPQPAPDPYDNSPGGYDEGDEVGPPPASPAPGYGNPPYGNDPRNGGGYGNNGAPSYPGGGYPPNSAPGAPTGGYYPGDPGNGGSLRPLPPVDVQNLTEALRSRSFDDARLPIVKQALTQSSVRADELAQLISTLSFDKSRIELAEYGYAHLSDPQNFYRVYDILRYPSSIREVQQALGLPQN
jgi:hypothetical protein